MKQKTKLIASAFIIAAVILIFDQWSKFVILQIPELSERSAIEITSFFNLALVFNRGVSFGMFSEHDQPMFLVAVAVVMICVLSVWLWQSTSMIVALAIGAVIGGAIGNVIDRFRYGAVVDFLDFHIADLHWPAFNVADSSIFIGVVVLCIYSIFFERKNSSSENNK